MNNTTFVVFTCGKNKLVIHRDGGSFNIIVDSPGRSPRLLGKEFIRKHQNLITAAILMTEEKIEQSGIVVEAYGAIR